LQQLSGFLELGLPTHWTVARNDGFSVHFGRLVDHRQPFGDVAVRESGEGLVDRDVPHE